VKLGQMVKKWQRFFKIRFMADAAILDCVAISFCDVLCGVEGDVTFPLILWIIGQVLAAIFRKPRLPAGAISDWIVATHHFRCQDYVVDCGINISIVFGENRSSIDGSRFNLQVVADAILIFSPQIVVPTDFQTRESQ